MPVRDPGGCAVPVVYPDWLTAPEKTIPGTERVGRHISHTWVGGQLVTHQAWTATHDGQCPTECRPYKPPEPAKAPDTERLRRLVGKRGKARKPAAPMRPSHTVKPLALDGGY